MRTAGCRYALFIPLYILPRCFADAAVIRNYRDNHTRLEEIDAYCYIC